MAKAIGAVAVAVGLLASGVGTANASGRNGMPGYWFNPFQSGPVFAGYHGSSLGPQAREEENFVYCIETGTPLGATDGDWTTATDEASVVAATMADRNKNDSSDLTQAALAYAIHDHLDQGNSQWSVYKNQTLEGGDMTAVATRAATLWNQAKAAVPSSGTVDYKYTAGKREGEVHVYLKNSTGGYTTGVPWRVVVSGPVTVSKTSGATAGGIETLNWKATGNGNVTVQVQYNKSAAKKLASANQDLFKVGDPLTQPGGSIQFRVQRDFQPTVTTEVSARELARGQVVSDRVTSGVVSGDSWVADPKVSVVAKGYYFVGDESILSEFKQSGSVASPENPTKYLDRVKAKYGNPAGTATTTFTNAGQTNTVTAKSSDGSDFVNRGDGRFGSWLWVIQKSDQSLDVRDYVTNDFVDTFGQVKESDVHQIQTSIWSEVAEPHAQEGADVRDVIHVKGLPKDLGSFAGNDDYGFVADSTKAKVEVWWSGASGGNAGVQEEDMKFIPSTVSTPVQDDNHKLLRTVTYDLADLIQAEGNNYNGSLDIKVAGGDAGSPLSDGSHFTVTADSTGYYTFVFKYDGCARVKGFTSAYNDRFESTFVTRPKMSVALSSNANPDSVLVGEEFWDTAVISGDNNVAAGAYVSFDAYNPVAGSPDVSAGKLLDGDGHVLTGEQLQKLYAGYQVEVESTHIKAQTSGTVYWQASLHAANGMILATHQLGVKSESTVVKGGGDIGSVSQTQGAVGGPMWDIITVSDDTDGADRGNIPDGSKVSVDVYKHEGQNEAATGQLVERKAFPVDVSKLGARPGKYTFKALMDGTYPAAGQYNWVAKLIAPDGSVLAKGRYGEDTERTAVQEYSTDAAKKWLSDPNKDYSDKTIKTYDVLTQTSFEHWGDDMESDPVEGQTMKGTQATFSIWRQGASVADDASVLEGGPVSLPRVPDANKAVTQKVKSETFAFPAGTKAGTYYYGLRVTNSVDAANLRQYVGEVSDGLVYEAPKRVESESFDVVQVSSESSEPVWVNGQKQVEDTLNVAGNLPKGSAYEVEVWQRDGSGNAVKLVSTSGRKTLDKDITGSGVIKVAVDAPSTGSYQFRHKVWTPDDHGGDPTVGEGSGVVADFWKTAPDKSVGYADGVLLYEGANVPAERFEVIDISTDVTGTTNMHTASNGEHYVDVTDGADINDHVIIDGDLPAGYQLGFELYHQAAGSDSSKDTVVRSIAPTDVAAAAKQLDSAIAKLDNPGDYYWVTVFQKASGAAWASDGEVQIRSAKRVPSESFHAVRVTTTTGKWSSKGGVATDTALIEGCLPSEATIGFDLHEYESKTQAGSLTPVKLSELGYEACTNGASSQSVTSHELTMPDALDYYWVEKVQLPGDDTEFHRGDERVPGESTRAIDATTQVSAEFVLGTAVSDHTEFANIKYSTDGDIRDDLKASLKASWELWSQAKSDDVSKDTLVDTVDKDGVPLEDGQQTADSSKYAPKALGIYYWRVRVSDPDGSLIKYGAARDLAETFRIIQADSHTTRLVSDGAGITDSVTIHGPMAAGTMVSWKAFLQTGTHASKDKQVLDYSTPATGAVIITAEQARIALDKGEVTVTTPKPYKGKVGDILYWQFALSSPDKNEDGTFKQPVKDNDGNYTTEHLVQVPATFYIDRTRVESETANVIRVTTQTKGEATVGDRIHDTALIEGTVPNDDYCVSFEYWSQDKGTDVAKDKLRNTSECMPVPAGAHVVNGPEQVAGEAGLHYYRERLTPKDKPEDVISYGKPRVPGETVDVTAPPLAKTGVAIGGVLIAVAVMGIGGLALLLKRRRSRL